MKTLVFVDAENVDFLWAKGRAKKSGNQRRRLIMESIIGHASGLAKANPDDVSLSFHWADPPNQQLGYSHAARKLLEGAGARCTIHVRIDRPSGDKVETMKNTTDIGLAVDVVQSVLTEEGQLAVVLAAGDSDFIPLINWVGSRSIPVYLLHTDRKVFAEVFTAVRRTGGRARLIDQSELQQRPSETDEPIVDETGSRTGASPMANFLPGTSQDRLDVLARVLECVKAGALRSKADLDRVVGVGAEIVVPALTSGGPRSPYGRLITISPGGEGLTLNTTVKGWVEEAHIVWLAAAVCAQAEQAGVETLETSRDQLTAMGIDPMSATTAVARATQVVLKPDYIAVAKGLGYQCPSDPVARRALVRKVVAEGLDSTVLSLHYAAAVELAMGVDPDREWSVDDLEAAWVAVIVSRNPQDSWTELLKPDGSVAQHFLFGMPDAAVTASLTAIQEWAHRYAQESPPATLEVSQ